LSEYSSLRIASECKYSSPEITKEITQSGTISSVGTRYQSMGARCKPVMVYGEILSVTHGQELFQGKYLNEDIPNDFSVIDTFTKQIMDTKDKSTISANHAIILEDLVKMTIEDCKDNFAEYLNKISICQIYSPKLLLEGDSSHADWMYTPISNAVGNPYELLAFYPGKVTEEQAFEPSKRTSGQNNFLIAINGLRTTDIIFDNKSLENMKIVRNSFSSIVVSYANKIYSITGNLDDSADAIFVAEVKKEKTTSLPEINPINFVNYVKNPENIGDDFILRIDNSAAAPTEIFRYNNSTTVDEAAIAFLSNRGKTLSIKHLNDLYASGSVSIDKILDKNGNNLMHLFALNRNKETLEAFVSSDLFQKNKDAFKELLSKENNAELTPIQMVATTYFGDIYRKHVPLISCAELRTPNFDSLEIMAREFDISHEVNNVLEQNIRVLGTSTIPTAFIAADSRKSSLIKNALESGLNPTIVAKEGSTILSTFPSRLSFQNEFELAKLAVDLGANPNMEIKDCVSGHKETMLTLAINRNNNYQVSNIVRLIPETVNYSSSENRTPLITAVERAIFA
jgi:hypothetical protein